MMRYMISGSLAALLATVAAPVLAQSAGDWSVGAGLAYILPQDDNGTIEGTTTDIVVGDATGLTLTGEYFFYENVGVELLLAWPFTHDISLDLPAGDTKVADTQQLPPVLSLQYHFNGTAGAGSVSPFVGVGVNYTTFFNTDTTGMLSGTDLDLGDSWGAAFHAGVDYKASEKDIVRVDVRYIDIETEAELDGQKLDDVAINPWVFGMSYVRMF